MGAEAPPTTGQIAAAVLLDPQRRHKLLRYASAQFGINQDDGEDLLQETALDLLRYRSYVRSLDGFVFTVFRTRCTRFSGTRRVTHGMFSRSLDTADIAVGPQPQSDGLDEQLALREALAEISSSCRRLINAYYIEGQSLREAAQTMSLAYSSVARTISRCLQKLREHMA